MRAFQSATNEYAKAHADRLPPTDSPERLRAALAPYLPARVDWVDRARRQPYAWNPGLSGKPLRGVDPKTPLVWTRAGVPDSAYLIALDGPLTYRDDLSHDFPLVRNQPPLPEAPWPGWDGGPRSPMPPAPWGLCGELAATFAYLQVRRLRRERGYTRLRALLSTLGHTSVLPVPLAMPLFVLLIIVSSL